MRKVLLLGVLALVGCSGCFASTERECDAICETTIPCEAPAELWRCVVPERGGYTNVFCDWPGEGQPLEEICLRSCFREGSCSAPSLETAEVRVCHCTRGPL